VHHLLFADRSLYPSVVLRTPIRTLSWVTGAPLREQLPPTLVFEVEGGKGFAWPDFVRPAANIPLVSPRMRQALGQAGASNVDYHPAELVEVTSGARRPYAAGNVLGLVSAMDRERSTFEPFEEGSPLVSSIERLVLDEARCAAARIFRLAEFDLLVVVDDAVARALAGVTGVALMAPEEWDGFRT